MQRKDFSNLQRFVWRRHAGAHSDGLQHGSRKPGETSATEVCYKSVNVSLEELKNNKLLLFLIHELFRQPNPPKSHFVNQHESSFGHHVTQIQTWSITKPMTHWERKFISISSEIFRRINSFAVLILARSCENPQQATFDISIF